MPHAQRRPWRGAPGGMAALSILLVMSFALEAAAQRAAFVLETSEGAWRVSTLTGEFEGVTHVSLPPLIHGLGGRYQGRDSGITIEFIGETVHLTPGSEAADGSRGAFSLSHPVVVRRGVAYMARPDVAGFFQRGFGVSMRPVSEEPRQPEATESPGTAGADPPPTLQPLEPEDAAPGPEATESTPRLIPLPTPGREEALDDPPQAQFTVVVDPGHGGNDTGATGANGLTEKEVALAIARQVKDRLEGVAGVQVVLTREDDRALSELERASVAHRRGADLFVSIHTGASPAPEAEGHRVFFSTPAAEEGGAAPGSAVRRAQARDLRAQSAAVAAAIAEALTGHTDGPVKGVRQVPVRVLRTLEVPAVLVEIGVITHPDGEARLGSEAYQDDAAAAIASAIREFADELVLSRR